MDTRELGHCYAQLDGGDHVTRLYRRLLLDTILETFTEEEVIPSYPERGGVMPAYATEINPHRCGCGGAATHEVRNTYNASHGYFCKRCAARRVQYLNREMEREQRQKGEAQR